MLERASLGIERRAGVKLTAKSVGFFQQLWKLPAIMETAGFMHGDLRIALYDIAIRLVDISVTDTAPFHDLVLAY